MTPDLRERALLSGVQAFGDADLLALLLGTGSSGVPVNLVAAGLLESSGGVSGIARLAPQELAERRGLGPAKAARVAAALELGRRALLGMLSEERSRFDCYESVVDWARPRLAALDHEEVWLLVLDGKNGLKTSRRVAQGGTHACALTTRDILCPAVRDAGAAIVLVHNHPSGDPKPSSEDIEMTKRLSAACEVVGIPLLDHVIVARGGATSLFERST